MIHIKKNLKKKRPHFRSWRRNQVRPVDVRETRTYKALPSTHHRSFLNFLFYTGVYPINNVVIVSSGQWRDSAIHTHVSIFPQTPLPSRLPHDIEQSSLCCTVGPCWLWALFFLYWLQLGFASQSGFWAATFPREEGRTKLFPLATESLFSESVSLFWK